MWCDELLRSDMSASTPLLSAVWIALFGVKRVAAKLPFSIPAAVTCAVIFSKWSNRNERGLHIDTNTVPMMQPFRPSSHSEIQHMARVLNHATLPYQS